MLVRRILLLLPLSLYAIAVTHIPLYCFAWWVDQRVFQRQTERRPRLRRNDGGSADSPRIYSRHQAAGTFFLRDQACRLHLGAPAKTMKDPAGWGLENEISESTNGVGYMRMK